MSEFPRIYGHRGAPSLAPENTIASFSKAMEAGARWFEFDVDIIGDGSLIVIHDDTLDRTTNGSGATTRCRIPISADSTPGSGSPTCTASSGSRRPLMSSNSRILRIWA